MKRNLNACFNKVTQDEGWAGFPLAFLREVCVTFALHQDVQRVVDCRGFQMAVTREATADMDEVPPIYPKLLDNHSQKGGNFNDKFSMVNFKNVSMMSPRKVNMMKGRGELISETRRQISQRSLS